VGDKPAAGHYALRELESTQRAARAIKTLANGRAPRIFDCTQATLFLEYVEGLTLADYIAVRRSRPGLLPAALQQTGLLLAALHTGCAEPDRPPAFEWALNDARKYTHELFEHGVLEGNRLVYDGILRMLDRWEDARDLAAFEAAYVHGDATTSNFVFPDDDQLVAIDWERMHVADPALDLGRLMAEIGHSVSQHGGTAGEAEALITELQAAYQSALPAEWDRAGLAHRAVYYRATSILRIARNGWIPRQHRLELIAQAMALLAIC
jgi:aminoglycoside phosphotransferase (APT) family kinase protein